MKRSLCSALAFCGVLVVGTGCSSPLQHAVLPSGTAGAAPGPFVQSVVRRAATNTNGSEWPAFRRDDQRTGSNPYQTTITKANVATLKPKWTKAISTGVFSSPIVKAGVVYEGDRGGTLHAWYIKGGALKWQQSFGEPFISTPYFAGTSTLYAGVKGNSTGTIPAKVLSLAASTGALNWEYDVPNGAQLGASPLLLNGVVYEGIDAQNENQNLCDANHQLVGLDPTTGQLVSALNLAPSGVTGADIWASATTDFNKNLYVATGNECTSTLVPFPYANSIMRVKQTKPTMGVAWATQSLMGPGNDVDFGATPIYVNGMIVETGKDGYTYALDPASGAMIWHAQTGAAIGSSATDGTNVYIPTAQLQPTCPVGTTCGAFMAVRLSDGTIQWSIPVTQNSFGFSEIAAPTVTNGIVFAAFNSTIWALDASTGATLWSYPTPNNIVYSGLTVVNGGLLTGTFGGGTFYCFTPGGV